MDWHEELERLYPVIPKCPFCGGESSPNSDWRYVWVDCDECKARGPKFIKTFDNPIQGAIRAIEAWTLRSV